MKNPTRLRLPSAIRNATRGLAPGAAFLLTALFAVPVRAQTDLDGSDLIVPAAGPWNGAYVNSNEGVTSFITIGPLNNGTRYTYSGALTGNIHVDVTHQTHANNDNRFTLSNAGNTFTGGLTMHGGILHVTNENQLPGFTGGLTLDNAVFMAYGECNFDVTIPDGSFGGMRASGGTVVLNQKVTGAGDLVVVTDNGDKVALNGANNYAGVTSIGTVQGGTNKKAHLVLGANNALPSTTVVEIGKSQNANYPYASATTADLDLNGTTQTIAGLYGGANATVTNGAEAPASLTIDLADGASYDYSGTIAGNSATNLVKLAVAGAGNQTLAGNIANASLTKTGPGTLTLGGKSVSLTALSVAEGTLAFSPDTVLTINGKPLLSCVVNLEMDTIAVGLAAPPDCDEVADLAIYADATASGDPVWATNGVALAGGEAEFRVSPVEGVMPGQALFATFLPNDRQARATAGARVMGTSVINISVESSYQVGDDIVLALTPVNSTGGIAVTLYVPDGNGGLTAFDRDCTVVDNKVDLSGLPAGDYVAVAVLDGDENYLGSDDTKTFRVLPPGISVTVNGVQELSFAASADDSAQATVNLELTQPYSSDVEIPVKVTMVADSSVNPKDFVGLSWREDGDNLSWDDTIMVRAGERSASATDPSGRGVLYLYANRGSVDTQAGLVIAVDTNHLDNAARAYFTGSFQGATVSISPSAPEIATDPSGTYKVVAGTVQSYTVVVKDAWGERDGPYTIEWACDDAPETYTAISNGVTATRTGNGASIAFSVPVPADLPGGIHTNRFRVANRDGGRSSPDGIVVWNVPLPPVVSNVVARQRWPWNGLVDVDYEVGGYTAGLEARISFAEQGGAGRHWTATNFLAGAEPSAAPGPHRATWDTEADGATNVVAGSVVATVELVRACDP